MDLVLERCCGLDVHQATVVACLLTPGPQGKPLKTVRTFSTVSRELMALCEWLEVEQCTHIAMESTGVYWKPVYAVLEAAERFQLIVGNAQHIRNVPGRKTDVKDSEWLATLVRHGLIQPSFVPDKPTRALRDLLRYRRKLVEAQSTERNRAIRVLETANIKLASVASDVFGVSGRAMLRALLEGTKTPREMAELARGRLRKKLLELELALEGSLQDHHRVMLRMQLGRVERIEADIAQLDEEIAPLLAPHAEKLERLCEMPGVEWITAATLVAELGTDMSVFAGPNQLAAWAGLAPGSYVSAGKHASSRVRRGNVHLRTALIQAAIGAAKKKGTYLKDKFHRLKARRGGMRAAVAIARKLLLSAYHLLASGERYRELGESYLDTLDKHRTASRLLRRLEGLGYDVSGVKEPAEVREALGPPELQNAAPA